MKDTELVGYMFPPHDDDCVNINIRLSLRNRSIRLDYVTPDLQGHFYFHIEYSLRQIKNYIDPIAIKALAETVLPIKVIELDYCSRVDLEEVQRGKNAYKEKRRVARGRTKMDD